MAEQPYWRERRWYKEFTPQGQDQGRDFYRDFAQPSQAVRGDAATPGATGGLPQLGPTKTTGPAQPGVNSPVTATRSSTGRKARILALNAQNTSRAILLWIALPTKVTSGPAYLNFGSFKLPEPTFS